MLGVPVRIHDLTGDDLGDVLFAEGAPGDEFFVLVKGSADVRKDKRHIATLKAGDFAGEIALLSNAPVA
jgi:CRP-like cAMP-binding protein